jgi:hypothetical protein
MSIFPPKGAVAKKPGWVDYPKDVVGNAKDPKPPK